MLVHVEESDAQDYARELLTTGALADGSGGARDVRSWVSPGGRRAQGLNVMKTRAPGGHLPGTKRQIRDVARECFLM